MAKSLWGSKSFYVSAFLLLVGSITNTTNGRALQSLFPDRQPIPDTLFVLLPYVGWTQYFSDLANIFSCFLLAIYLFPRRWRSLPFVLAVLGLGYTLRGVLILLNPFGTLLGNLSYHGLTKIQQFGEFPSGHMFLVVAIYFFIERKEASVLKWLALGSVFVEVISQLLSRGHYSIDLVGGFFLAFFCYHMLKPHKSLLDCP